MDLIVQYNKYHSKYSPFHITSIGQMTIILAHVWLMEHNPEIDWHTGEVHMTRCPASCGLTTLMDQLSNGQADKPKGHSKAKPIQQVHVEDVREFYATSYPIQTSILCGLYSNLWCVAFGSICSEATAIPHLIWLGGSGPMPLLSFHSIVLLLV